MQTGQKAVKVSVSASSLHRRDRIPTCCATRRRSAPAAARARRSLAEACSLSCGTQWVAPRCGPVASPLHLRRNCCRVFDGINVRMETAGLLLMTRHARPRGFACACAVLPRVWGCAPATPDTGPSPWESAPACAWATWG